MIMLFVLRGTPPTHQKSAEQRSRYGFTLIEMSIVLIIIGLLTAGILVGRDLVKSSEAQAQVSQIQKYQTAVHTFQTKFGGIPGDLDLTLATQFGFLVGALCDGKTKGRRDGNGVLDGWTSPWQLNQAVGEVGLFWQDLSSSTGGHLIDGTFPAAGAPQALQCNAIPTGAETSSGIPFYFPTAKIASDNFIYVYEVGGVNYYGLSAVTSINVAGYMVSNTTIPVAQTYSIDKKIDDGVPTTGNVIAQYLNNSSTSTSLAPNTTTSGGNSTSCYDTTTNTYSIAQNGGNGENCALSFKFQ